jgi:hypothetical protein
MVLTTLFCLALAQDAHLPGDLPGQGFVFLDQPEHHGVGLDQSGAAGGPFGILAHGEHRAAPRMELVG